MSVEPCWVCGSGPHEPQPFHVYTTEAEVLAEMSKQPSAEDFANGSSLLAEAGLPLGKDL